MSKSNVTNKEFAKRTLAYAFELKCYSGQKLDKHITEGIRVKCNASSNSGRFNKNLFPNSKLLKLAQKRGRSARETFNYYTLPWQGGGVRILPASTFHKFIARVNSEISLFEDAARDFCVNYQGEVDNAMLDHVALGRMFDARDYPHVSDIQNLFSAELKPRPVSTSDDFRVGLTDTYLKQIKSEYEDELNESRQDANKALWTRLQAVVEAMSERLSQPKAVFRDSLVENVRELTDVMDGLNIFEDKDLEDFTNEIRDTLTGADPKELRNDAKVRKTQADKATNILGRMRKAGMA